VISVFLTLAVVPALYTLVARNTRSPEAIGQLLDRLRASLPGSARRPRTGPGGAGDGVAPVAQATDK
jgi:hypothetical protein